MRCILPALYTSCGDCVTIKSWRSQYDLLDAFCFLFVCLFVYLFSLSFPPNYFKNLHMWPWQKLHNNFHKQGVLSVNDDVTEAEVNGFNPECFLAFSSKYLAP